MRQYNDTGYSWTDWLLDRFLRSIILAMLLLPYRVRVPAMGWVMRKVIAPISGYNRRSAANLDYIYPDMLAARQREIVSGVADNMGRTFIENYSPKGMAEILGNSRISGDGLADLAAAKTDGKPVILVSGHFGNYEAPRLALLKRGYNVGGLYRRARNRYFNRHYEKTFAATGGPVFAQGREGTTGFVRHLKSGGILVILSDQHVSDGAKLTFLGKPAATSLSAAQLALRYHAHLIPFYGTRRPDGLHFDMTFEAPITHSDPETMTRELVVSLEAQIRANPEQWLWIHRRWKIGR